VRQKYSSDIIFGALINTNFTNGKIIFNEKFIILKEPYKIVRNYEK